METAVQDRIEREAVYRQPIERVFAALTEPNLVQKWFCNGGAEIDLRPGGMAHFHHLDYGSFRAIVAAVEPPRYFAWRWVPGGLEDRSLPIEEQEPLTLVEFFLEPVEGGTRLRLTESGFGALVEDKRLSALADNNTGWDECLNSLAALLDGDGR